MKVLDIFSWLSAKEISLEQLEHIFTDYQDGIFHNGYTVLWESPNNAAENVLTCKNKLQEEQEMELKVATNQDKEFVMNIDKHIGDTGYENRVQTKCGYVIWNENQRIGTMSHCLLWNQFPFLNFLFVKEEYRGNGFAKQAVLCWEAEMKQQGYQMTLISTQADEGAQHLYRKLGYIDCGGLVLHDTPFDQPMELFFRKVL